MHWRGKCFAVRSREPEDCRLVMKCQRQIEWGHSSVHWSFVAAVERVETAGEAVEAVASEDKEPRERQREDADYASMGMVRVWGESGLREAAEGFGNHPS